MRVYRVAIHPVVTYRGETMILTKSEEEKLRRFERKIMRKIYGSKRLLGGTYPRQMNSEVHERLRGKDIVNAIKTQRLRSYGHISRMGEEKVVRKVTEWKPDFRRARERPKIRWEEQVLEDTERLRIHNWKEEDPE